MTRNNKTNRTVEKNMDRIIELLSKLRFYGMLETYRNDCRTTSSDGMTNDEFLKWLLESEYDYRRNVSIERLIRSANFRYKAYMEKIDYTIKRNLDRNQLERLASLDFIRDGQNIFITGSSGTGKSYIASAIGYEACKNGVRTLYSNASKLMGQLKLAKNKGTIDAEMKKIEKCSLLILDDLFLIGLDAKERSILMEIIEDRHGLKSIIITSQLPVESWYDAIGDPTVADAILDRIVHTAHKIELTGDSVRKINAKKK